MKRFYKAVTVTETLGIMLDGRPVRTPARALLTLPTAVMAEAVAAEWDAQSDDINPHSMPITGLANAALDRIAADTASFAKGLSIFGGKRTVVLPCCRA